MGQESIGQQLKKVRLEKGISIDEAHRQTKIHLDILKAIEEDNLASLNPVYLKGFLKIYCHYLGVELPSQLPPDPRSGMLKFRAQAQGAEQEKKKTEPLSEELKKRIVLSVAVGCAAAVAATGLFLAGRLLFSNMAKNAKRHKKPAIAVSSRAARAPLAAKPLPRPAAAKTSSGQAEEQSFRVGIRAIEDCWVQLKADNRIVFQNILKKGRFESWEARDRMELSLGSAGGIQLELNGKLIPPLGKKGEVRKNIIITRKEGLLSP